MMVTFRFIALISTFSAFALAGNQHLYSNRARRHISVLRREPPLVTRHDPKNFTLIDKHQGSSFFDGFDFWNFPDPTHGNVEYVGRDEAFGAGLASIREDGVAIMTVDTKSQVPENGNRKSVRIQSKKSFNQGLFILDVMAMPHGCGVWPAAWMVGPDWPAGGEIDIVEGVHDQQFNQYTLHTSSGCTLDVSNSNPHANSPGSPYRVKRNCGGKPPTAFFTGNVLSVNCDAKINSNTGCGIADNDKRSYGKELNDNGGGVFATLWDDAGVKIWHFARDSIPCDITKDTPDPSSWPAPIAFWSSSTCPQSTFFKDLGYVFDITLCGDWAGSSFDQSGCSGTCGQRVMDPANFKEANWKVNYLAVYQ